MQPKSAFLNCRHSTYLRNVCVSFTLVTVALLTSNLAHAAEPASSVSTDSKPALLGVVAVYSEKAIGGTGRSAKAIGGTGRTTKAIGGTGRATKAIGGTGRVTKAIGGTGRATKAIGGTGRVTKAIGGTGRFTKSTAGEDTSFDAPFLRGAIEGWDSTHRELQVLGQAFHVGGDEQFAIGAIAVVEGNLNTDGRIVADYVWTDSSDLYVPGSTDVVITGRVTNLHPENGRLSVGSLIIDYTQLLWDGTFTPSVGMVITVLGTQPILKGEVQARVGITR